MLTETQWVLVVAVLALIAVAGVAFALMRATRKRHEALRERFGPEYHRAVEDAGNVARAERELLAREKRVREQRLHPLSEGDRLRFAGDWSDVQTRFVDDPSGAVQGADELIRSVMLAQGYEVDTFEQRCADLSVDHAEVLQHYRAAHELAEVNRAGQADTEELRQAMVHYRALFADLLERPAGDGHAMHARAPERAEPPRGGLRH